MNEMHIFTVTANKTDVALKAGDKFADFSVDRFRKAVAMKCGDGQVREFPAGTWIVSSNAKGVLGAVKTREEGIAVIERNRCAFGFFGADFTVIEHAA